MAELAALTEGSCGYIAFYKGKQVEVWADNSYEAQLKAAKHFKAKRSHEVSVHFCEKRASNVPEG
jgi:hypothetical protein